MQTINFYSFAEIIHTKPIHMKQFNIGIIGCGHIAEKMADTLGQMEDACCYAVASRSQEKQPPSPVNGRQRKPTGLMSNWPMTRQST